MGAESQERCRQRTRKLNNVLVVWSLVITENTSRDVCDFRESYRDRTEPGR